MMKLLILCMALACSVAREPYRIAFGKLEGRSTNWGILSDNVMGGRSDAALSYTDSAAVLTGTVSLQNRGGFVSIKSGFGEYDLSKYQTVRIVFKATGQQFAFTLENSRRWFDPAYKHAFNAEATGNWQEVTLPLTQFQEERIGQPTGNLVSDVVLRQVLRLGISTTEKKEGPFEITIASVTFE